LLDTSEQLIYDTQALNVFKVGKHIFLV